MRTGRRNKTTFLRAEPGYLGEVNEMSSVFTTGRMTWYLLEIIKNEGGTTELWRNNNF
jgi:hypothetical protein